jgi:hypothetical protein
MRLPFVAGTVPPGRLRIPDSVIHGLVARHPSFPASWLLKNSTPSALKDIQTRTGQNTLQANSRFTHEDPLLIASRHF